MNARRMSPPLALGTLVWLLTGCLQTGGGSESTLKQIPITGMEGVVSRSGISFDTGVTADGNGSLRIEVKEPTTVRLYEVEDPDVENARLVYRASVRTEEVAGTAYLEMWCRIPGRGEFFSRALHAPLTGTTEWTSQETPFFLKKGQNPDHVRLNLVVEGTGTVWVDDIVLATSPLP